MNEKIKNIFSYIGAFFSGLLAILLGVFIGKSTRKSNNSDSGRIQQDKDKRREFEDNKRTEERIYNELGTIFDGIEKRNNKEKN